jgi:methane/ammonia monooxygenase subunit C
MWFGVAILALAVIGAFWRIYLEIYGFSVGLDATAPEFQTYWFSLLWAELAIIAVANVACWTYLIVTRDRDLANITPEVEFKRYYYVTLWLVAYTAAIVTIGVWTDTDAMWHQMTMRDTAFTPTHIILFYGVVPMYLFFGVGAFIYAMTRTPIFANGISFMFLLAVIGPFLILPNIGFNEWGHAFWLTEEFFAHPLHWGFVALGISALALAGVAAQIAVRLAELFPIVFKVDQKQA